ncbi:C40 family peptidase [Lysinibacillus sphaericus]|uniref:C40 family peptidase n=1 Tax=Lysinibacillus sphaericus TaxID=1421 RepID=UPI00380A5FC5
MTRSDLQPGDLIFFKTASYAPVTHVGMYVGNGQMFNANDSGVEYSNPFDAYLVSRIVGYGRVGNFYYERKVMIYEKKINNYRGNLISVYRNRFSIIS